MLFLQDFFRNLNDSKIEYCVLRNYENLPEATGGSDLDILIKSEEKTTFFQLLWELSEAYNGGVVSYIPSDICPRICLAGQGEQGWGLMIDLHYDEITYRGYSILSKENIWRNTFLYREHISVLNNKADAYIGLLKELLNNQECEEKYFNGFKEYSLDRDFLNKALSSLGNSHIVSELLSVKDKSYSKEEIQRLVSILNKAFPHKKDSYLKKVKKLERLNHQPGYTLAVLGTDGSGKSTLINSIKPTLNDAFHNAVYYEHLRPNQFPSLAGLFGKPLKKDNEPVTNPHESEQAGFLGSFARWFYYLMDYTIGFFAKVWPKKAIRSCVWIFDRYYYDCYIDPKRSRIRLPNWILKIGQFLIPEPDIILCLGTDAEKIHQRKPELPLSEVERQVKALRSFCNNHPRAHWIDTGQSIEASTEDAMDIIINVMSKRFESVKLS